MNSESENNYSAQIPTGTNAIEKLKAASRTAVSAVTNTPYQPIVYAVPKEYLEAGVSLLKEAALFQPTLYEKISALSTKEEEQADADRRFLALGKWSGQFADTVTKSTGKIIPEVREVLSDCKKEIERDGKTREKFLSDLTWKEERRLRQFTEEVTAARRSLFRLMIVTMASSGAISALVGAILFLLTH